MQYTLSQLAAIVSGELDGPAGLFIDHPAPLEEAGPGAITYAGNKLLEAARSSAAGVVLVPAGAPDLGRPVIRVANPRLAFIKVLAAFDPTPAAPVGVHPTAVVGATATLGDGVSIQARVVVEEGARIGDRVVLMPGVFVGCNAVIGDDTLIHPNVTVGARCQLGKRVIIQPGAVIGADGAGYEWDGEQHIKIPHIGIVVVEDDVEIGATTCIDRSTMGATRIGRGTKIDNQVQIAHNCTIGKHCLISGQTGLAGSTILGNRVMFAGRSGAAGHLTIGDGSVVMATAVVTKDLAPGSVVSGYPARPHREQLRLEAALRKVPDLLKTVGALQKGQ
ncbi:MAG TPA: UDP-3-O-(3-hydroxymyristoyl)glucosamine N-acyltransferase [Symbiobacteriaceae bacterium]|nr:UDP-3-O-(3-hydroxymyristoyl)glucosamine N-acyltransferase [Symbiobacteriaceae bacterium]